ncbi:MAG: hypothetical protein WD673_02070 [Alphaproteobacteria bacterium]
MPLWALAVGEQPVQSVDRPAQGYRQEIGNALQAQFVCTQHPFRIDLVLRPSPPVSPTPGPNTPPPEIKPFETIGAPANVLPSFLEICGKILPFLRPSRRIALGLAVFLESKDNPQLRRRIETIIPELAIDDSYTLNDIALSLNQPTSSHILDNERLNVIRRWNVIQVTMGELASSPPSLPSFQSTVNSQALRFELDISTDALRTQSIPRELISGLLQEFSTIVRNHLKKVAVK